MNPFFAEHLLEFAPDAFLLIDTEGRVHYANRAVQGILGYRPEDLTGLKVEHLIPHRLRDSHHSVRSAYMLHPAACGTPPRTGRLRALRRDGSEIDVEISLSPVQFEGELHTAVLVREAVQSLGEGIDPASAAERALSSPGEVLSLLQSLTAQLRSQPTDAELQSLVDRQEAALAVLGEQLRVAHRGNAPA